MYSSALNPNFWYSSMAGLLADTWSVTSFPIHVWKRDKNRARLTKANLGKVILQVSYCFRSSYTSPGSGGKSWKYQSQLSSTQDGPAGRRCRPRCTSRQGPWSRIRPRPSYRGQPRWSPGTEDTLKDQRLGGTEHPVSSGKYPPMWTNLCHTVFRDTSTNTDKP